MFLFVVDMIIQGLLQPDYHEVHLGLSGSREGDRLLCHEADDTFQFSLKLTTDEAVLSGTQDAILLSGSSDQLLFTTGSEADNDWILSAYNCQIGLYQSGTTDLILLSPNNPSSDYLLQSDGTDLLLSGNEIYSMGLSVNQGYAEDTILLSKWTQSDNLLISGTNDALLISGTSDEILITGNTTGDLLVNTQTDDQILIKGYTSNELLISGNCNSSVIEKLDHILVRE